MLVCVCVSVSKPHVVFYFATVRTSLAVVQNIPVWNSWFSLFVTSSSCQLVKMKTTDALGHLFTVEVGKLLAEQCRDIT